MIPVSIKYWSKATLGVYLIHGIVRKYIFPEYFGYPENYFERLKLCLVYLLVVNILGILITIFSEIIQKGSMKIKNILLK